jgi:hypothetical protein
VRHALVVLLLGAASAHSGMTVLAGAAESAPNSALKPAAPRVVLIASPGMEDLVVRLVAEMHSLQIEVARAPDTTSTTDQLELGRLAQKHHARVAVRVSKAGPAVDLWLVKPQSQELVYRRVMAEGDPAVLVLRSLEILRGTLIDLGMAAASPRPAPANESPPPMPAVRARREPPPHREPPFWLGLSGGLVAPRAGSNLGATAGLSLQRELSSRFALRADVLAPLHGLGVNGEGGQARIRLGSANLAGLVRPWRDRTLTPAVGLGVGALAVQVGGEAQMGYTGRNSLALALFPHCRAELGLTLTQGLRLRAALAAGFATPRPVLLFATERQESWLNPLVFSTLGIEIPLP